MGGRMKTIASALVAVLVMAAFGFASDLTTLATTRSLGKSPIAFTQNNGQWDEQVLFRADAGGATVWFCKDRVVYQFTRRVDTDADAAMGHSLPGSMYGASSSGNPVGFDYFGAPLLAICLKRAIRVLDIVV
jgi:hypothetical protein